MTTLQENQLRVLNETIATYTLDTRCTNDRSQCKYYIEGHQGCAVGRLIHDIDLRKMLDAEPNTSVRDIFHLLPEDIQELGKEFLIALQVLHDKVYYWAHMGLSSEGKEYVELIKEKFKLINNENT